MVIKFMGDDDYLKEEGKIQMTNFTQEKPALKSITMWSGSLGLVFGLFDAIQEIFTSPEIGELQSSLQLIFVSILSLYGRVKADKRISGVL